MSAPEEIAEIAADGVADGLHVVSEEALALEKATRGLEAAHLGFFALGLAAGGAIGGLVAFKVAYRKAETKFSQIADEEIAEMREHYNQKIVAQEAEQSKGDLESLVRDKGYSPEPDASSPPMAVTPPTAVVERAEELQEDEVEAPPAEPDPEPEVRNIFAEHAPPEDNWDWHKERARRSPMKPYVIHIDERSDHEAYDGVTYTYYAQDDVVCNERDEVMPEEDRDRVIGETNLEKFGHGSGDAAIVYVRNDQLEMDMEIIRSPNSFAEEVHGFEPEIKHSFRRRERATFDDD